MRSVLRLARKCKSTKRLRGIAIIDRETYPGLNRDTKIELMRARIPLGLMHMCKLLDEEAGSFTAPRYARKHVSAPERC